LAPLITENQVRISWCPGTLISSAARDELLAGAFKINPEDIDFKRELGKGGFGRV